MERVSAGREKGRTGSLSAIGTLVDSTSSSELSAMTMEWSGANQYRCRTKKREEGGGRRTLFDDVFLRLRRAFLDLRNDVGDGVVLDEVSDEVEKLCDGKEMISFCSSEGEKLRRGRGR